MKMDDTRYKNTQEDVWLAIYLQAISSDLNLTSSDVADNGLKDFNNRFRKEIIPEGTS